jgi:ribonuclease HI
MTKGWKRKANRELWSQLDEVTGKMHRIAWRWVQGHAGDPENERAHELAQNEIERVKRGPP